MKSGFVSIVGRPNVGKSTLLNSLLQAKIAITSNKAQTTRNSIQGIYTDSEAQIVFIDTPGIHKPVHKLGNVLNKKAYQSVEDVDVVLFLIDVEGGFGKGDQFILNRLKEEKAKVILILNKVDRIPKEKLLPLIDSYKDLYPFEEIVPISALKGDNVATLIEVVKKYLTGTEKLYDEDTITNVSNYFYISEIVREKVLRFTEKEVPHAVTCYVETYEDKEDYIEIGVVLVVDRDNLKKIIIGKQGSMLKQIGSAARVDLEEYLGKKVFLKTYVKTMEDWRDKENILTELGLKDE